MEGSSQVFLDHARHRLEQRGITPAEVDEALDGAEVVPAEEVPGTIRFVGSTAAGRRLTITRLAHFPVIVSVAEAGGPQ